MEVRHEAPAAEDFAKIEEKNMPVVFHGLVKDCRACEKWDPEAGGLQHLKTVSGESVVQAMLSKDASTFYGDIRSHQRVELRFGEFLDMVSSSTEHNEHIYLAQVPIHVKDSKEKPPLSSLASGISMPEFLDADAISNINFWMSSTSSRSSIHYDPYHNVLTVVSGQKEVTLWPPSAAPCLYPMPLHGEASNHSQVNFVQPNYERYPRFREASKHSQTATLNAGDAIFIPEGWFHQVNSAPLTIAVNFWWPSKVSRAFNTHMDAYYLRRIFVSLLDAEKEAMLGRNCVMEKEPYEQDNCKLDDMSVEGLTAYETNQLHTILSWTASILDTEGCTLPQEDAIANVFANIAPLSLRRILLVMVLKFPRTLEALVMHGLSPVAAELLTRLFEQIDSSASESSQSEFYKMFYSVFDDSQAAMGVLLDKKEEFAAKALKNVMDKFLNLSF